MTGRPHTVGGGEEADAVASVRGIGGGSGGGATLRPASLNEGERTER